MTNLLETFIMKDKSSAETDIETNYGKKKGVNKLEKISCKNLDKRK